MVTRVVSALLLALAGALALSNMTSVQILADYSKVKVLKPVPPRTVFTRNLTMNAGVERINANDNTISDPPPQLAGSIDSSKLYSNMTDLNIMDEDIVNLLGNGTEIPTENNSTDLCVRQDFEDHATAIFFPPPGPVDGAFFWFNSSIGNDATLNATQFDGLKLLNQTEVDCEDYPSPSLNTRRLGDRALSSLVG